MARINAAGREEKQATPRQNQLQRQQWDTDLEEAMEAAAATMHGITATEDPNAVPLGPTITAEVEFEGSKTLPLLDTGSAVTIVSLEFTMKALVKKRPEGQQVKEWKEEVRAPLESLMVKL